MKNEDLAKAKAENGGGRRRAGRLRSRQDGARHVGHQDRPYLEAKAGPFTEVRSLIAESPDEAGKRFGYREKPEGMPWTIATRLDGRIVAANTASRAATVDVDVDGDGVADAVVQIGPVIRGTALRDGLDFISFNAFTNQIDYAQFAKSLNTLMAETTLAQAAARGSRRAAASRWSACSRWRSRATSRWSPRRWRRSGTSHEPGRRNPPLSCSPSRA